MTLRFVSCQVPVILGVYVRISCGIDDMCIGGYIYVCFWLNLFFLRWQNEN